MGLVNGNSLRLRCGVQRGESEKTGLEGMLHKTISELLLKNAMDGDVRDRDLTKSDYV